MLTAIVTASAFRVLTLFQTLYTPVSLPETLGGLGIIAINLNFTIWAQQN